MFDSISERIPSSLILEARACLKLAFPLAAAFLAEGCILFVDTLMMGWLNSQALAGGSLGTITFRTLESIGLGLISGVGAIAAIAIGENNIDRFRRTVAQGLWLAIFCALIGMILLWNSESLMLRVGQQKNNVVLASAYVRAIMWGLPASLGFAVIQNAVVAINRPKIITAIMVGSIFLNGVTNYIFMFGKLGLPAMGLAGIGWASTVVLWFKLMIVLVFVRTATYFKPYKILKYWYRFEKRIFLEIWRVGWASGGLVALDLGFFFTINYLMGYLGTVALIAYHIAKQVTILIYNLSLGISLATMSRVGQMLGKQDFHGVRKAGFSGIILGIFFAVNLGLLTIFARSFIVSWYIHPHNTIDIEAVRLALIFLELGALFSVFDSAFVIVSGALRGIKDTYIPMLIGIVSYWGIGMGFGSFFAFYLDGNGVGLWLGAILSMLVSAVILAWRFYHLTKKLLVLADEIQ